MCWNVKVMLLVQPAKKGYYIFLLCSIGWLGLYWVRWRTWHDGMMVWLWEYRRHSARRQHCRPVEHQHRLTPYNPLEATGFYIIMMGTLAIASNSKVRGSCFSKETFVVVHKFPSNSLKEQNFQLKHIIYVLLGVCHSTQQKLILFSKTPTNPQAMTVDNVICYDQRSIWVPAVSTATTE